MWVGPVVVVGATKSDEVRPPVVVLGSRSETTRAVDSASSVSYNLYEELNSAVHTPKPFRKTCSTRQLSTENLEGWQN